MSALRHLDNSLSSCSSNCSVPFYKRFHDGLGQKHANVPPFTFWLSYESIVRSVMKIILSNLLKALQNKTKSRDVVFLLSIGFLLIGAGYYYCVSHARKAIAILLVGVCIACVCYLAIRRNESQLQNISAAVYKAFPILLFALGSFCCLFFPAGSVPDEPVHFYNSYSYYKTIFSNDFSEIRAEDAPLFNSDGLISTTIAESRWGYVEDHFLDKSETGMVPVSDLDVGPTRIVPANIIADLPQQKLASALGIGLGIALNLNHVCVFYLGRLFNMAIAVLLVVLAVRVTPICKNAMMVVALFPMTLHLFGSYSYDAPTIGLSFLMTALVAKLFFGKKKEIGVRFFVQFLVVLFLLAPCKVVYACIGFVALFAPCSRFASRKQCIMFKMLVIIVVAIPILTVKFGFIHSLSVASGELDSRGDEVGVFWSLSDILSNPLRSFLVLWSTVEVNGALWLFNIPGNSLGWFQVNTSFPSFVPAMMLAAFCISCVRDKDDSIMPSASFRIVGAIAVGVASFGIVLSMWLGWTFVTETVIQGVQGRYFLPLMPLVAGVIRSRYLKYDKSLGLPLVFFMLSIDMVCFEYISAVASG